jgi:DNA-binding MarR family transcriptional regulator
MLLMARLENLLGAYALAVADGLVSAAGASASEGAALVTLLAHRGQTVGWLGEVLSLTSSGATRLVGRLDAAGWLVRSAGPDARERRLDLTVAGRQRAGEILEARHSALERSLAVLTAPDREHLEGLLGKVLAAVADERLPALRVCRLCDRSACRAAGQACPLQHTAPDV